MPPFSTHPLATINGWTLVGYYDETGALDFVSAIDDHQEVSPFDFTTIDEAICFALDAAEAIPYRYLAAA